MSHEREKARAVDEEIAGESAAALDAFQHEFVRFERFFVNAARQRRMKALCESFSDRYLSRKHCKLHLRLENLQRSHGQFASAKFLEFALFSLPKHEIKSAHSLDDSKVFSALSMLL